MHFDTADPNSNFTTTPSSSSRLPQNGTGNGPISQSNDIHSAYHQHIPQVAQRDRVDGTCGILDTPQPYDARRHDKDDRRKASNPNQFNGPVRGSSRPEFYSTGVRRAR